MAPPRGSAPTDGRPGQTGAPAFPPMSRATSWQPAHRQCDAIELVPVGAGATVDLRRFFSALGLGALVWLQHTIACTDSRAVKGGHPGERFAHELATIPPRFIRGKAAGEGPAGSPSAQSAARLDL